MRRKQATALIDEIRALSAGDWRGRDAERALGTLKAILRKYDLKPLEPCDGAAHSNPFIDNCQRCAPRWGFIGPVEVVS